MSTRVRKVFLQRESVLAKAHMPDRTRCIGGAGPGAAEVEPPPGSIDGMSCSRFGAWGQLQRVTQLAVAQARDTTSSFFTTYPEERPPGELCNS